MKLSSPLSPSAVRQQRQDRLRRDRAAAQALRAAFPTVGQLRLDLRFAGSAPTTPASQAHVLHPPARAFFEFPCPYADCDGQFNLTAVVRAALASTARHAEGALECSGLRAKDHTTKQPCKLQLNYTVTANYQRDV
jgi:hypothetical protein